MKKWTTIALLAVALIAVMAPAALASEGGDSSYHSMAVLACGIAIGVAAFGWPKVRFKGSAERAAMQRAFVQCGIELLD